MTKKTFSPPPIVYISLFFLLLGAYWWFNSTKPNPSNNPLNNFTLFPRNTTNSISSGERILITEKLTLDKQAGVEAFAKGDFKVAIAKLESSLKQNPNDPESLIYLENAKIGNGKSYTIATSIPIGGSINVAQEQLRGNAQAQTETNRNGGINGVPLKMTIADDQNKPELAAQIAEEFAKDNRILAVVGHNVSAASLSAAEIYKKSGLVAVSPTSNANKLSEISGYVYYRILPSTRADASTLVNYATKSNLKKVAICADYEDVSSQSLKAHFMEQFKARGGRFANTYCDLAAKDFNAETIMPRLLAEGADTILLLPNIDRIKIAIDMAKANQGRLTLMGSSAMNTYITLQLGQKDVNGMVVTAVWHPNSLGDNSFAKNAEKLWNGIVNWRTATAFDAMQVVIAGLRENPTRNGLQQVLSQQGFSVNNGTATGTVKFLPSGDRDGATIMLKIQPSNSQTGYDFAPL